LGVIKDLEVTLTQVPIKSIMMDIVVADIDPKFGLLLSRSWSKKVGGTMQMDMYFSTIPIFGGEFKRLYREVELAYIGSDQSRPANHPIYEIDDGISSSILFFSEDEPNPMISYYKTTVQQRNKENLVWKLHFDGSHSREGVAVGIFIVSPDQQLFPLSYKLEFETTNNITKYEGLLLGLKVVRIWELNKLLFLEIQNC